MLCSLGPLNSHFFLLQYPFPWDPEAQIQLMLPDPMQVPILPRSNCCLLPITLYFIGISLKAFITLYFVSLLFIDVSDLNFQTIFFKTKILFWFIFTSFAGFSSALITADLLWQRSKCMKFSISKAWIQILILLPTSHMTFTEMFDQPEPQLSHLKEENNNICFASCWES